MAVDKNIWMQLYNLITKGHKTYKSGARYVKLEKRENYAYNDQYRSSG